MNNILHNYNMEEENSAFTNSGNNNTLTITADDNKTGEGNNTTKSNQVLPSANASSFSGASGSNLSSIPLKQEAITSDIVSSDFDLDEFLYNIRMSNTDAQMDNEQNPNYFYGNGSQAESLVSSNIWSDNASNAHNSNDMTDTFDFLIKSISSANNYVSTLTREQLAVLRSIRPSLLYEFLQEIARVRSDRRMRRALPNECAFCKNNGENEECYTSHALKDFRGRVLCPVLRAFRCPKCDATGDRAHTIKYCPENFETDWSASMGSRRRSTPPGTLVLGATANRTRYGSITPNTPASSPSSSYSQSYWATLTMD